MASLSHSERSTKDNHNFPSSEDTQWLELGLGFSIAPKKQQDDLNHQPNSPNIALPIPFQVSASASSHLKPKQKPPGSSSSTKGLELGLSLGLALDHGEEEEEDDDDEMVWRNQQEDHYGDYDDMAWWWACHMNNPSSGSLKDWQMPVPNDPHDYSTRIRPHSGLWFTLQSYTNRKGEALPQIPKAYIRVKDENVTIFMVKKYLVTKLGLSNEAEVEIWCMGQRLMQAQTLKQVRDCVWLPSFVGSHNFSLQTDCVNNHLMSLCYGRRCAFN
ncbi:hypothetical protein GQ457_09G012160 [Hibiscus cannabinus]